MDAGAFRNMLVQMALSDGNAASRAVLFAMLAVSQCHRGGDQRRAIQFKVSAINALAASARNTVLETREAIQHVAAGMLLCSFEVRCACRVEIGRLLTANQDPGIVGN